MAKHRSITVAGIQTSYGHDMVENIRRTEAFVREAARRGAQVILPSELFQGIYFCTKQDPKWTTQSVKLPSSRSPRCSRETIPRCAPLVRASGILIPSGVP